MFAASFWANDTPTWILAAVAVGGVAVALVRIVIKRKATQDEMEDAVMGTAHSDGLIERTEALEEDVSSLKEQVDELLSRTELLVRNGNPATSKHLPDQMDRLESALTLLLDAEARRQGRGSG